MYAKAGNMSYKLASEQAADVCALCNSKSIVFDSETSEAVCSSCGMVIKDNIESMGPEWRSYSGEDIESKSRTGMPSSLAFHDMGLSTFISYSNVDANGVAISAEQRSKVQRMRRWNKISSNNRSYHRNLKNAFAILSTIKDKLSLSDTLIEKAAYNYRKALDKKIIKGRSIRALIVAAVYAACRDLSVPRTLEEISAAANTDAIFAGKCYRLLVQNLDLRLPVIDSNKYLARISNKAKVSEKTYRNALEMLSTIKDNPISHGKDPNALAVAVLYAACLKEGENVSQAQVAVAGDISIVTLRKRFQDVRKIFPS
ncbi:putative transcription initiation factor IIB [Candidatus Nitrososphaera gargensis Ga9.2]|uniref:Putative transcription initiation factor IIB n=2 Tax=Candidatus Nitrososphaera gargensis TaxID=497727 RepID=K0IIE8_NITGG|nr:putative transcription initiation factor IIB [Candidatus Nitrososphaera gargensis Ga9.2]